jgi:hypothetical protein
MGHSDWDIELFDDLCTSFVKWIKCDNYENCKAFYDSVEKLRAVTQKEYRDILDMIAASKHHLKTIRNALNKYTLDATLSCYIAHCDFWAKIYDKPFDITTDDSKQIDYWRDMIDFLTNSLPDTEVGYGSRKHKYPLLINNLKTEDSQEYLELQLADILAGAVSYVATQTINRNHDDFSTQILKSKLSVDVVGNSMWPSKDMTPEQLNMVDPDGIDPLDFLAEMAMKNPGKYNKAWKGN